MCQKDANGPLNGGSSNGRTTDSDSVNPGSNPGPPATPLFSNISRYLITADLSRKMAENLSHNVSCYIRVIGARQNLANPYPQGRIGDRCSAHSNRQPRRLLDSEDRPQRRECPRNVQRRSSNSLRPKRGCLLRYLGNQSVPIC